MAFLFKRSYSTTALLRRPYNHAHLTVTNPCPVHRGAVLESSQLQQLAQKASGPWKALSKEEVVQLYRASFPATMKEIAASKGHYKIVIPAVLFGILTGIALATFLSRTIGPTRPHTINNPEWEAASRERLLGMRSNPIEGLSAQNKA